MLFLKSIPIGLLTVVSIIIIAALLKKRFLWRSGYPPNNLVNNFINIMINKPTIPNHIICQFSRSKTKCKIKFDLQVLSVTHARVCFQHNLHRKSRLVERLRPNVLRHNRIAIILYLESWYVRILWLSQCKFVDLQINKIYFHRHKNVGSYLLESKQLQ